MNWEDIKSEGGQKLGFQVGLKSGSGLLFSNANLSQIIRVPSDQNIQHPDLIQFPNVDQFDLTLPHKSPKPNQNRSNRAKTRSGHRLTGWPNPFTALQQIHKVALPIYTSDVGTLNGGFGIQIKHNKTKYHHKYAAIL